MRSYACQTPLLRQEGTKNLPCWAIRRYPCVLQPMESHIFEPIKSQICEPIKSHILEPIVTFLNLWRVIFFSPIVAAQWRHRTSSTLGQTIVATPCWRVRVLSHHTPPSRRCYCLSLSSRSCCRCWPPLLPAEGPQSECWGKFQLFKCSELNQ